MKTVVVPIVPAEVDDVWSGSLVSAFLIAARIVGAKSSGAAEAAFEGAAQLRTYSVHILLGFL